jgi:hypothetical protein
MGEVIYYSVITVLKTLITFIVKKYIMVPVVTGVARFCELNKKIGGSCPFIIVDKRLFYIRGNFGFKFSYCRRVYISILTVHSQISGRLCRSNRSVLSLLIHI